MERAITHWPPSPAQEIRVLSAEQIFPDLELLRALDDEPPSSRVLVFRRAEAEVSSYVRGREEGSSR